MDTTLIPGLFGFVFVACFSPGPNNLLLMSSGALFGWRRTLRHLAGVQFGFAILVQSAVFGLGSVLDTWPWLLTAVKVGGATWLVYMAARFLRTAIFNANVQPESGAQPISRPFRFYEAVLFQWVNPKAIIIALSAAGAFVSISDKLYERALLIGGVYLLVGCAASSSWMLLGEALNRSMTTGRGARPINAAMGVLLLVTAISVLIS